MKKIFIVVLSMIYLSTFGQTDCRPYVPSEKGTKWELTNYSGKGKELGIVSYELLDKIENGKDVTFKIRTLTSDAKGKETFINEFEAYCKDGKFEFDMAFKMDGGTMQAYQDMDVSVDASEFEVPSMDEKEGTILKDGALTISVGNTFNMTINITDRKIEAREKLETEAGKFDCVVLSQKVSTKMIINVQASSKEWYSEGIGLVRSESYNKKGKLTGYSVLTKLN